MSTAQITLIKMITEQPQHRQAGVEDVEDEAERVVLENPTSKVYSNLKL